jgi:O-Antigen ligase
METGRNAPVAHLTGSRSLDWARIDPAPIGTWTLAYALVLYLGLKGGGYDLIPRGEIGIAAWWLLAGGVLVGAFPLSRIEWPAWIGLGLLSALLLWTALGVSWSGSAERSLIEVGRVATYLAFFGLAVSLQRRGSLRLIVGAVGTAIATVAVLALLSRLQPNLSIFPVNRTAEFLPVRNRLSYPVNYWNGLADLLALGVPLLLAASGSARTILQRSAAAALVPALALTTYLTLSRGGSVALLAGVAVYLILMRGRLTTIATVAATGLGGAILVAAASQRDALQSGAAAGLALPQGNEMLAMTLVVCSGVGLIQAAMSLAERHATRPAWLRPSRAQIRGGLAAVGVAAVIFAGVARLPSEASDRWQEFKSPEGTTNAATRFESFSGNGRYQWWGSALDASSTAPLFGIGAGTFEFWWSQHGSIPGFIRDAHSLYLETLAELGIVGLVLIAAFLIWVLGYGTWSAGRAERSRRAEVAGTTAAIAAFCVSAGVDWVWELAVIPAATLLLSGALLTRGSRPAPSGAAFPAWGRIAVALAAIVSIVVVAVPLASTSAVRLSQGSAAAGDLSQAVSEAKSASEVEPFAATPRLQAALLLERQGNLAAAAREARAAATRESANWRIWTTLSRIEAKRGHAAASVAAYRRARRLNPRSPLFAR